ncbi:MAG: PilZ domain-containing protein [Candidatus Omnitrophica bacterium]|nr:PilZ domain-containing protein [Candidatus Omnitrophota bacterium]MBI3083397.1 PilZ domain-containing protein [Candidatus Omnitrophota bacterium]
MAAWQRALGLLLALGGWWPLIGQPTAGWAAETADPIAMSHTLIVLTVGSKAPLAVRTSFKKNPPTITIALPRQQVTSSLPERSTVAKGPIQTIAARYEIDPNAQKRFLESLQIVLSASYAYHVRSEPGRIVVEIHHPSSVDSAAVEVAVWGGTIIGGLGQRSPGERFRAMQEALARVTPTSWAFQLFQGRQAASPEGVETSPGARRPIELVPPREGQEAAPPGSPAPAASTERRVSSSPDVAKTSQGAWGTVVLAVAVIGMVGFWLLSGLTSGAFLRRLPSAGVNARLPSSAALIGQLVWRAFARQGYELIAETELTQPFIGALRIIVKDGVKAALLFVGNGSFFEKQTVQRFIHVMRNATASQGFLVASGSFTVPAQRLAKEHRVTLIGREQLTELLSIGAGSEYALKQLQAQEARLEEAKETLRQSTHELETLRRQRNEASWFLGEERAKSVKLEALAAEANQQLSRYAVEIQRWEEQATMLRRQWEESEWYLGESRSRVQHLETQLAALQELAKRVQTAERERDEANWYLGEERARGEAMEARLANLQRCLEETTQRESAVQAALDQLREELGALRTHGERRSRLRLQAPEVHVEVHDTRDEPVFAGSPRDVSEMGVGLESDEEFSAPPSARIRLHLPGHNPIESTAQLMWQRQADDSPQRRYRSGYRFVGLSSDARALIEEILHRPG